MPWKFELLLKPETELNITEGPVWDGECILLNEDVNYSLDQALLRPGRIDRIYKACLEREEFARAMPERQPDFVPG